MWMCKARTAVIRNGRVIPGGTPFGIRESERAGMDARGFKVYEVADPVPPDSANVNTTPEKETGDNTSDIPVASTETGPNVLSGGTAPKAPPMKGTPKASVSGKAPAGGK